MKTIKLYWHYLMCTVSRKYRLTHVQHVDELPPWTQRRMRRECEEMDGRGWTSAEDMMRDLLQEIDGEKSDESAYRKVASFA